MRKLKTILVWLLVSIVFQVLLLSFMDMVYLPGRKGDVEVVKYAEIGTGKLNTGGKVNIPEDAEHIRLSFDASYAAYMVDGKLMVVNVKSGEAEIVLQDGFTPDFYSWLPDRNIVIYSAKGKKENNDGIRIETYDADSGVIRAYPEITGLPDYSHVVDIQLSTLTNLVYVKVVAGEDRAEIYKYNIMDQLSYVMTMTPDTAVQLLNYSDVLLYQHGRSKIMLRNGSNSEAEELDSNKSMLLGSDDEDVIYLGELDGKGDIAGIKYGTLQKMQKGEYSYIVPEMACPQELLEITQSGDIYVNEPDKNVLHDIRKKVNIKYKGTYVGMADKYLITRDNNMLNIEIIR